MTIRSGPWRFFIATGLLVASACAVVLWILLPRAMPTSYRGALITAVGTVGGGAVLATLVLSAVYARLRRRVIRRVIQTVRELSAGDATGRAEIGGEDDLLSLAAAVNALRGRLSAQVELIDRQRGMLQALVDHLQEGVVVARADGRIALINPAAVRLLNIDVSGRDALVDQAVELCIPQHPLQRMLCPSGQYAAPKPPLADDDEASVAAERLEIENAAGTTTLLARASDVVLALPGAPTAEAARGRVVTLTDVTALQRIIQMRSDFVANASHELRTPLSTIRAAVEVLLTMDLREEAPAARAFLEKIDRHSIRLEMMVADLLDLARLETPAQRFAFELVECRRLFQDLHDRFADVLERKGLHWAVTRDPPDAEIHASPYLLRLVLDNLVDNAIKFTDEGGTIEVRVRVEPTSAVIEVRDTGCGIPEDELPRVWERFYQVQRARSGPERGTGLGLSIVRHAASAMNATVQLASQPMQGTVATITIPQPSAESPDLRA